MTVEKVWKHNCHHTYTHIHTQTHTPYSVKKRYEECKRVWEYLRVSSHFIEIYLWNDAIYNCIFYKVLGGIEMC